MSIFDLKTNVSELSSVNNGVSRMSFEQNPPTRDVSGVNFPNGQISFRWETSGTRWWIPSRSYLRMRFTLKTAAAAQLTQNANLAPQMNLMASLFQSLEMRINDKTVSRVADFVPQIDSLQTRISKSKSWLSGVGNSANFWKSQFKLRQVDVTQDGKTLSEVEEKTTLTTGLVGGNFAIVALTGVVTFANSQAANPFVAGDVLEYTAGGVVYKTNVVVVTNNTTLTVSPLPLADAAGVADYNRTRKAPYTEVSRNVSTFELIWTPCLSLYKIAHALPCGRYELILTPQSSTSYQRYAVESLGASKTPDVDYQFRVVDMYHYTNTVEGPRCDDLTYFLDLENVSCQSEAHGLTNSFIQKNFDISPSSNAVCIAYADSRAGTDTRFSPTKFRAYNAAGTSSVELGLDRLMIQYAGASYPSPDAQLTFTPGTDFTTQRYLDSLLYSGQYFDTGGAESIDEFHERGAYYYFSTPKDGSDRSTRLTVNSGFGNAAGADLGNMRLLLFSFSKQVARIKIENSRLVDLQIEDS